MIFEEHDLAGAVFLFSEDRDLVQEMNYAEFEALVDGYVPSVELANRDLFGAYCEINSRLKIKNVVFFAVGFDPEGFVRSGWSVPLFRLASHSRKSLDLGDGKVGLACASHCPIPHLANLLWDPNFKSKREFKVLVESVERNRMAIHFKDQDQQAVQREGEGAQNRVQLEREITASVKKEYDKEIRDKIAQAMREQSAQSNAVTREREDIINQLKQDYNARIQEYRLMLDEHKKMLEKERERNDSLKNTIDGQAEKIRGLREYFEVKLEKAESIELDELSELKESHEIELQSAVENATRELNELLQMRDVEIMYRKEQEAKLAEELDNSRRSNDSLINGSGDNSLLTGMIEAGISFVTFQPGAGHITLPLSDIVLFMEDPATFVAEYCGVTLEHYNAWLNHYSVPVCQVVDEETDSVCGENIDRIESPADFKRGESDCCKEHRTSNSPRLKLAGGQ